MLTIQRIQIFYNHGSSNSEVVWLLKVMIEFLYSNNGGQKPTCMSPSHNYCKKDTENFSVLYTYQTSSIVDILQAFMN